MVEGEGEAVVEGGERRDGGSNRRRKMNDVDFEGKAGEMEEGASKREERGENGGIEG